MLLDQIKKSRTTGIYQDPIRIQDDNDLEDIPTTIKKLYPAKWDLDYQKSLIYINNSKNNKPPETLKNL